MGRPTNEDIYNRESEIEEGTEAVVATAKTFYPDAKIIEAEVKKDDLGAITGYEVTVAWQDATDQSYHVHEVTFDANGGVRDRDARPNVPPGQAGPERPPSHVPHSDKEKSLSERKADVKLKKEERKSER